MSQNSSSGIGIGGILLIVFITLKLSKVIIWSWWWVLSPIWIGLVFWLGFTIIIGGSALIYTYFKKRKFNKLIKNVRN